ncbi:MAG: alpha/beta fold hydrolase [Acidobacteria bacterium]|nr:MAG: alpha/beta fold hydrolase [Acidobacteriota bacterium]
MPLIEPSGYRPPVLLRNPHLQTLIGAQLRRVPGVPFARERLELPDGDFLDLDWWRQGADRVAILCHGLEGNSRRVYMRGMARTLARRGWDVLAWNYRGCGGEPNRLLRSYHSGATEDLDAVVRRALQAGYARVALVGFSLGGNLVLKYLGERGRGVEARIAAAAAISAPCDLAASAEAMARPSRRPYMRYFLRTLARKVREKSRRFPGAIDPRALRGVRTFREFDGLYTAPVHGFASAEDYWRRASSLHVLPDLAVPSLLLNARDDPFLAGGCYPSDLARGHSFLHAEFPRHGGHVGFVSFGHGGEFWSESRVAAFLDRPGSAGRSCDLPAAPVLR